MPTIFGQRNDPFGFQPRWKQLFPHARDVVVLKENHFPMCDAPDLPARDPRLAYGLRGGVSYEIVWVEAGI
jgi:hypothetical protein